MRKSWLTLLVIVNECLAARHQCHAARLKVRFNQRVHDAAKGKASASEEKANVKAPEDGDFLPCPPGATDIAGCQSICKYLELTAMEDANGGCRDFEAKLNNAGYGSRAFWKIFRKINAMDPVLDLLSTNAHSHQVDFHLGYLESLLKAIPEAEQAKYSGPLQELRTKIQQRLDSISHNNLGSYVHAEKEDEGGTKPLPVCSGKVEPGDFLTFEVGGPDFSQISSYMSDSAANGEALQIQRHFAYGKHFGYGKHFDYGNNPYDVSGETSGAKRLGKNVANFFAKVGKLGADITINVGKGLADLTINVGKGLADFGANVLKQIGRALVFTGAGITALYSAVRQTTSHTEKTKWTHSEVAVGYNKATSAQGVWDMCHNGKFRWPWKTKLIVSRFVGDRKLIIGGVAKDYRSLAAQRALMWEPYLKTYASTIGQWHKVILGKCLNVRPFNAGNPDYWQAVTKDKVHEMWNYVPTPEQNEKAFFAGIINGTKNNFRSHDQNGKRVKPKAMFCSKFSSSVWSSVIGNPTSVPDAAVRHDDVNKMFPFNPGSCSPWTIVQWMLGTEGRKYWSSCIAEPAEDSGNPCK